MPGRRLGGTATTVVRDFQGNLLCTYHETIIASLSREGKVTLRNGGWLTLTTLRKMNEFSWEYCRGEFRVVQRKEGWYVEFPDSLDPAQGTRVFTEGMTFSLSKSPLPIGKL